MSSIQIASVPLPFKPWKKVFWVEKNGMKVPGSAGNEKVGVLSFDSVHGESLSEELAVFSPDSVALPSPRGEVGPLKRRIIDNTSGTE